ncbi:MAG TPA: hypothetical protein HPP97_11795 [Desulfuromonadales bacterium]|nr:hypothetical protein [Desulfuromonadales bacterium]
MNLFMVFLTIGLMVGIATIVTLVTLTRSMSSDIERKMDEFGANILVPPFAKWGIKPGTGSGYGD